MKSFIYKGAESVNDAVAWLTRYDGKAALLAGGTDLLGKLKDDFMPQYPQAIINIKRIPGLDFIKEEDDRLRIGALVRLHDIATHPGIQERFAALGLAALKTASPNIRQMGTIGGNICQDIRCWYYRSPNNRFPCLRKGGGRCYAIEGENRYHSIFGGSVDGGCYAVHPSDTAPALIALNASIKTSGRTIPAEEFFTVAVSGTTVLEKDEIVTEIIIPREDPESVSTFLKFSMRSSIDFPIANCAVMISGSSGTVTKARICLNSVFVKPYRAVEAEAEIVGKSIDEKTSASAAEAVCSRAKPLRHNSYMVKIVKSLLRKSIMACGKMEHSPYT